jgi:hypothetical protein
VNTFSEFSNGRNRLCKVDDDSSCQMTAWRARARPPHKATLQHVNSSENLRQKGSNLISSVIKKNYEWD